MPNLNHRATPRLYQRVELRRFHQDKAERSFAPEWPAAPVRVRVRLRRFLAREVLFEDRLRADPGKRYPLCLEGERACPPEDVGGVWGYVDFLEAIADPENEQHQEMRQWIGRKFDPEAFNPVGATRRMKRGLPDWRVMR